MFLRAGVWCVVLVAVGLLVAACGSPTARTTIIANNQDFAVAPPDFARVLDMASVCGPCAPPNPLCDVKAKRCVACLADGDCPEMAICKMGQCVPGCSPVHSACGDAGSCDVDMGRCHGCLGDRDCKDNKAPLCDLVTGRCQPCLPDRDKCPDGAYCATVPGGYACMLGCRVDADCAVMFGANGGCCDHLCVDLASSHDNCGGCAAACGNGACCSRRCVDSQTDIRNCGGCGMMCPVKNNQPVCKAGQCAPGNCLPGFADCDGQPGNGCEVSIGGDRNNCGACGMVCAAPNADPLCLNGACTVGGCKPGFRDCNMSYGDGCEVNVNSDTRNCGACGANCANLPNAVAGCVNGACAVGMCNAGFGNCNKMDVDGCEAQVNSDLLNCGACGVACMAPANVAATCANGICGKGGCLQGYADCDNAPNTGCEVKLTTDVNNCGSCGKVCMGMGQNAVAACVASVCSLSCNAGYVDCDNSAVNGCEVNKNTDVKNCGGCGVVCGVNTPVCLMGVCSANNLASCAAIKLAVPNSADGFYTIDPDQGGPLPQVKVWCDMAAGGQTVYQVVHNWGEWGAGMNIVIRELANPAVGTLNEWTANCAIFGKNRYAGMWKNTGQTYSLVMYTVYNDSKDWWDNYARKVFPNATYNDFVILQDSNSTDCWAWYAEAGSLQSFGSPAGAGYAFCRGGTNASKRYHIYLCLP